MKKTLLVTNDFPPRAGGIQTFLEGFATQIDPLQLVVYASTPPSGAQSALEYDATLPYQVVRYPGTTMLPTPGVRREMQQLIREHAVENVWFGAAAPLGIMANAARAAGARRIISTTHGHEIGWSMLPGSRQTLRKVFADADVVTYLTNATLRRLAPFIGDTPVVQLHGAIDPAIFAFDDAGRQTLRARYGITPGTSIVACISRLVERKGQDTLIDAWPRVTARFPGTKLVIVGKGPYGEKLRARAAASTASADIVFTGEVPFSELPAHYSMADIFAMPARTRGGGLDIEGLGIVYLEAYAAGRPVVAGDSGGAPEAVLDGETGIVTNGRSADAVAAAIEYLLEEPARAAAMGSRGREWVEQEWTWSKAAVPLLDLLS
ncbi:phosphatidylinositol alpha-1,6-mannosyltransferase [Arcanobacterium wilhelmae]|uniref:Phosphatidylinositol alpha-1,6-mannosyltransferase n=1 Tax=Arcanobacterium wilhelmae TaxID=1803177 RepID=A0ABT9ND15_9ACTO|nr:glycosyltransferase family 4 protein [Arcanobacterium wilhelmae]MDP9801610.1 phosphatidylinositol alpha-1,6-mannosyltransferase [Arcanobacterium wilhelmae]WFN90933.1 glycosyltransferase family 4 protein [Arcanobacterium wilhelmae]